MKKLLGFSILVMSVLVLGGYLILQRVDSRPRMTLGLSKIELDGREIVGVQVDRVIRDIAWQGSVFDVRVPPDHLPQTPSEIVPYMEGARAREMMSWAGVKIFPLTPARGKKECSGDCSSSFYFAADGQGYFPFLIDPSKAEYKTVYLVQSGGQEKADLILPDTHGFNMIAEQAYLHRQDIYLVMACMDTPAKAAAALYLAQNGLNIYAPTDRFANELVNYQERFDNVRGTIIGSAPIKKTKEGAVIGNQPVTIYLDEPIIVQYTDRGYPDQYYDTPWRYFTKLIEIFNLNLKIVQVMANTGETGKVVEQAKANKARVIAVRVNNENDYQPIANWLRESSSNRAVLFHSVAYEWGVKLFTEFPTQTTFGDLVPKIER